MSKMKKYLEYIKNAGEGATMLNFIEDWEPIGAELIQVLLQAEVITIENGGGRLMKLTPRGEQELK